MIRIDLHTHSAASPDGGLDMAAYRRMLQSRRLQTIAITDHDTIAFALEAQQTLGNQIIVGEEISTRDGELIGLYLTERIGPGLSARETAEVIRKQQGLVYVPHPFETVRHGVSLKALDEIAAFVDIVETRNGRAIFQNRGTQARAWAIAHGKAMAASSDAHGRVGWGKTASIVPQSPTRDTLVGLLAHAQHHTRTVGLRGVLYPKYNRFARRFR